MSSQYTAENTSHIIRADVDGTLMDLHYNAIGEGDQTLIMMHGSGPGASGWANFNRNITPFVEAGYRVLLLDSPGWSKSSPVVCSGSRSDLNASALLALMDKLDIEQAHLVGNSMGGHSVVAFALRYPDRVGKLVLRGNRWAEPVCAYANRGH